MGGTGADVTTLGGAVLGTGEIAVFLGLDVGKGDHHGHGLTTAGQTVFGKRLPNGEPKLRAVFDKLTAKFGRILVIVDQPAPIGALSLAVARDADCQVACLPGPAMRRIADLYPKEAKTDAHVIADAARTMPRTLRALELADGTAARLTVLTGFHQGLAAEATRTSNRLRGLLTRFPLPRTRPRARLDHPAVTHLLERFGSPPALRKAGRRRLVGLIHPKVPRMAERLVDDIFDALDEQTVVVPGTGTLGTVVPSLARAPAAVHEQRRTVEAQISELLESRPLSKALTSMPGSRSGPPPPRWSPSAAAARSPPPPTWPPTRATPRPPGPPGPPSAEHVGRHWWIGNQERHVRDTTFDEDTSRVRTGTAPGRPPEAPGIPPHRPPSRAKPTSRRNRIAHENDGPLSPPRVPGRSSRLRRSDFPEPGWWLIFDGDG